MPMLHAICIRSSSRRQFHGSRRAVAWQYPMAVFMKADESAMETHEVPWRVMEAPVGVHGKAQLYRAIVSAVRPQYVAYEGFSRVHQILRGMLSVGASSLLFPFYNFASTNSGTLSVDVAKLPSACITVIASALSPFHGHRHFD